MEKTVFFAFRGDPMCFSHVLLNALDMKAKGGDTRVVLEGEAVKLIKTLTESQDPLFKKARESGIIDCVCKACSYKMGVLTYNESSGIPLSGEMSGHPAMLSYTARGYTVITM